MKYLLLALLTLASPALAVSLSPLPAQTLTFPAGRDLQPVAFSPAGAQLLTQDAAGLTLWQVQEQRALWRSRPRLDWFPYAAEWQPGRLILRSTEGRELTLDAGTGRELGRGQFSPPAAVREQLRLGAAEHLRTVGRGVWRVDPAQPIPFDIGGGQLAGYYALNPAQDTGQERLALKRPGDAPVELWSGTRLQARLETIFPATGITASDLRFAENLSFSPGGRWLAWSARRRVTLWDTHSGEKVAVLRPDPYQAAFDNMQVVWSQDGKTLLVYSDRALWRYRVPEAGARDFVVLDRTPAPKDALIRTVSPAGGVASGTGHALLLSRAGADAAGQALGPVPQRVFLAADGRVLALAWPTLWVMPAGGGEPRTLRLPDWAEGEHLTLDGERLTVYGRDLSWTPGTQPEMVPTVWQADLGGLADGQTVPLARVREDRRATCPLEGSGNSDTSSPATSSSDASRPDAAGSWVTSVLPAGGGPRLCQRERQLSGVQDGRTVWTRTLAGAAPPLVTPDGAWAAPAPEPGLTRWPLLRTADGAEVAALTLPTLPPDTFWSPTLRVDPAGRWAALQSGAGWYLADLRAGTVQPQPALAGAADVLFAAGRLAAVGPDRVEWFTLR